MEVDKIGVHRTHCCKKHGCKYGEKDCPVRLGEVVQDYPCEDSDEFDDCFSNNFFSCNVDGKLVEFNNLSEEQINCLVKLYDSYKADKHSIQGPLYKEFYVFYKDKNIFVVDREAPVDGFYLYLLGPSIVIGYSTTSTKDRNDRHIKIIASNIHLAGVAKIRYIESEPYRIKIPMITNKGIEHIAPEPFIMLDKNGYIVPMDIT